MTLARLLQGRIRRAGWVVGAALVACIVGILALGDSPARWLVLEDGRAPVDVVVVLAGDPDYERTRTASRIVLQGDARLLIVTGGEAGPGDHANSLRAVAVSLGVRPDRIRAETASSSTREALIGVRAILEREGVHSVGLVTSPYHQRRAFLAARRAWPGLTIRNYPARPSSWSPAGWLWSARSRHIVLSEYGKLVWYGLHGWL